MRYKELRTKLQRSKGRQDTTFVLRTLFCYSPHEDALQAARTSAFEERWGTNSSVREDEEKDADSESEESDDEGVKVDVHSWEWVQLAFGKHIIIQYLLETLLEVISFCLIEPITLELFPFFNTAGTIGRDDVNDLDGMHPDLHST